MLAQHSQSEWYCSNNVDSLKQEISHVARIVKKSIMYTNVLPQYIIYTENRHPLPCPAAL